MATMEELTTRLMADFTAVPNATVDVATTWMTDALFRHGVKDADPQYLPDGDIHMVVTLASAIGARRIAMDTAHYFRYQDGDEMVDKTKVSEQWLRIANTFDREYRLLTAGGKYGSTFKVARRIDRA